MCTAESVILLSRSLCVRPVCIAAMQSVGVALWRLREAECLVESSLQCHVLLNRRNDDIVDRVSTIVEWLYAQSQSTIVLGFHPGQQLLGETGLCWR